MQRGSNRGEDSHMDRPKNRLVRNGDGLTAGCRLVFEDAGEHDLKGVPDRWRLYRVVRS